MLILKHLILTSKNICRLALSVGFDACGVVSIHRLETDARYMNDWVARGLHGNMSYLERNCDKRYDPTLLVPSGKTMIVCLLTYEHSGRDYHRKVKSLLYTLEDILKLHFGEEITSSSHQHIFCDSAPILERRWCVEAGLGFIGKNHQLIHPILGSMVHPGEMIINLPIESDAIVAQQYEYLEETFFSTCADCNLCVEACPSGALRNSVWDARQCVAYTTHHCLACQQVCPYNQKKLTV